MFPIDLFSSEYECTVRLFFSRLLLYDLDLIDSGFLELLISPDLFFTWFFLSISSLDDDELLELEDDDDELPVKDIDTDWRSYLLPIS
jgi:hypothetical protein